MEDILASIRRIIADEEPGDAAKAARSPSAEQDEMPEARPPRSAMSGSIQRPAPAASRDTPQPAPRGFSSARLHEPALGATHAAPPQRHAPMQSDRSRELGEAESGHLGTRGSAPAPSEDEVFELTDELIFEQVSDAHPSQAEAELSAPEPREEASAAHPAPEVKTEQPTPFRPSQAPAAPPIPFALDGAASNAGSSAPPPSSSSSPIRNAMPGAPKADDAGAPRRAAAVRSLWSRRELPGSGPATAPSPSRPEPSSPALAPNRASAARWTGDFQAPVSDEGPRSFFEEPETPPIGRGKEAEPPVSPPMPNPAAEFEAAIGQLAKNAVTALNDEELSEARRVDFAMLDETRKAPVAQSFAQAVDWASRAGRDKPADLQAAPAEPPAAPTLAPAASAQPLPLPAQWGQQGEDAPPEVADLDDPAETRVHAASTVPVPAPPFRAEQEVPGSSPPDTAKTVAAPPSVARAERVGESALTHPPSSGAPTLEESVRAMLRPLLNDWLDANMPRILEEAIRQEIKARGLPWDKVNKP